MGCASSSPSPSKREQRAQGYQEPAVLAAETSFTANEVEALYELYKKLSYSIFKDGLIHKLREMVVALLDESDLCLSDSAVDEIVDYTFGQADSNGDGRIDPKEWEEFVKKNPTSLRNMSLPYLQDITTSFPSFVMHSEVENYDGVGK
ncbi:hypothetical protein CFC21_008437 [Triticum aestivum]|uniref:Calcineurin B-like protein n=3 Tax=Triticum TaxID=4564 RepID=A0A9R0R3Q3_TRITD|nr:calcineurin B-like protein 7 [Triticum aestivum]KAF6991343.1 hypothetical protein CFC21_008437 [Triticum aestivum]VAH21733.1 unnamed protein product [Triticum turgidum subsp. durum]